MVSPGRRSILYKINGSPSGCLWLWVCVKTKVFEAESAPEIARYDDGMGGNFKRIGPDLGEARFARENRLTRHPLAGRIRCLHAVSFVYERND
jgi:hypothetical protein